MSLGKYLAFDKIASFINIIKQNGGIRGSLYKLYRQDELKDGVLIGEDKLGNKYYENPRYFFSRNRWVEYSDKFNMDYDGSQVPAEWFGWLHYKTDLPPHQDPNRPKYKWMLDYNENMSGTTGQFTPYSTTRSKVEPWVPPHNVRGLACVGNQQRELEIARRHLPSFRKIMEKDIANMRSFLKVLEPSLANNCSQYTYNAQSEGKNILDLTPIQIQSKRDVE